MEAGTFDLQAEVLMISKELPRW